MKAKEVWATNAVCTLLAACLWLGPAVGLGRDYSVDIVIDSLEDLYDLQASGDLEGDELEVLEALYQRPMNINRADRYLLYDLPDVTYQLADAIIAHRTEHGAYTSLEQLADVVGMTPAILASIAPFATVGEPTLLPVVSSTALEGDVELGTIVRRGFGKDRDAIDALEERERGAQSYVRMRGSGLTLLGAGGLLTYRRRTSAHWDLSRGYLVSDGPDDQADVDNLYLYAGYRGWSVIVGSYNVGFGERLTFDSTTQEQPHGWYENDTVRQDNESGAVHPRAGQLGVAASLLGAGLGPGWIDATVFGSWTREDLYMYDFDYGLDAWYGIATCDTDGDCPVGYTCDDDRQCRSSRVYDADDPDRASYRYESLREAFDEKLAGGNLSYAIDERTRVGVTGYYAMTDFNLAKRADPRFAYGARYPRARDHFGALGVDARAGWGSIDLGAEYARTSGGGNGLYVRATVEPTDGAELFFSGRYYDAHYENPHGRGRAASDELFGLAARNEIGARVSASLRPTSGLRLVTVIDVWGNPWLPVFDDEGVLSFVSKRAMPIDVNASQRATWSVSRKEGVSFLFDYRNKDVRNNSRAEAYDKGDFCDEGTASSNCGRGERRRVQLQVSSRRITRLRASVSYTASWEDLSSYTARFDLQQRVRVHGRAALWEGGQLIARAGFWFHRSRESATGDPDDPVSDRQEPRLDTYVELQQRIGARIALRARYGVIHYRDERAERFAYYHLGKITLQAKF